MTGFINHGLFGLGATILTQQDQQVSSVRLKNVLYIPSLESIELLKLTDGTTLTPEQMHNNIQAGRKYHTRVGLARAEVEAFSLNGKKFVRSVADGTKTDNLLSLPQF